jgi:AcrR family transcriptional regulator
MSHILKNVAIDKDTKCKEKPLGTQSKEWILQAFLILLQKKTFERITIKEISIKAGIDRKTFYRNFVSKYDVLQLYLDRACKEYIENLRKEKTLDTFTISKVYFEFCLKHIDFLRLLDKSNMLVYILTAFEKYLPEIYKAINSNGNFDDFIYDYGLSFFTGGFWNMSVKWIRGNTPKTPIEMASIAEKIMTKHI